jgi:hypothetical protein
MAAFRIILFFGIAGISGTPQWIDDSPQIFDFYTHDNSAHYPAHRYSHAAIADSITERMIVSHGYFYDHINHQPTWLADTWAFSFITSKWVRVHDGEKNAPTPRYGHSGVQAGRHLIIFGGDGIPAKVCVIHASWR